MTYLARGSRRAVVQIVAAGIIGGSVTSFALSAGKPLTKQIDSPQRHKPALPTGISGGSLSFIENRGQFDPEVRFRVKEGGTVLWFTNKGIVVDLARPADDSKRAGEPPQNHVPGAKQPAEKLQKLVFSETFTNGKASPAIDAALPHPEIYNYFIGNDPKNWRTAVPAYSQLLYHDVWPGIDVRFAAKGADIEQEFLVHPGVDPSQISIAYSGVKGLQTTANGALLVQTAIGPLRESSPRIYQEIAGHRNSIPGSYQLSANSAYKFRLGRYDAQRDLVIDPTLLFSTYLGGVGIDLSTGIAVDPSGNSYVSGYSYQSPFPTTPGAFQTTSPSSYGGGAVVSKFDPLGRLAYSTYLAGPFGGDVASAIAVNANGEAYVAGRTYIPNPPSSDGFPTTTSNAFQSDCDGSAFMTKLNANGTALLYSTCLGYDRSGGGAAAIALDANNRAYVTGATSDGAFPTTADALQPTLVGITSAFLSVVDPSLSGAASLVYSTHLGGERQDFGSGIAVDAYGIAYLTGNTSSSKFPVTPNVFEPTDNQANCGPSQCTTGFVAKLNPRIAGAAGLIYSSYLGGTGVGNIGPQGAGGSGDYPSVIAVDSSGSAYVGGRTINSLNFPTTKGAFQTNNDCPTYSAFVAKVNPGGSALTYSTLIGSVGSVSGSPCATVVNGIALDPSGTAYIVGKFDATRFPVTPDAFQTTYRGGDGDAILTEFNASGSGLVYSTYLGGSSIDGATGIALDATGDVYVVGVTGSDDFPVTPFAYQPTRASVPGRCIGYTGPCPDFFITKLPLGAPGGLSITGIDPAFGGNAGTVSPEIVGSGFHAGATAQLNCGGQPIVGTNINVGVHGRLLNNTFDLTTASPGLCDLLIKNADGTSASLAKAFTVQQGGAPNIRIQLTGAAVREGGIDSTAPFDAIYATTVQNTGNVDSSGGVLSLPLNSPFTGTSADPPDLAPQASPAEMWAAGPQAAGSAETFTATATVTITLPPGCTSDIAKVQSCYYPNTVINWIALDACIVDSSTFKDLCGTVAAQCVARHCLASGPAFIACLGGCLADAGVACAVPMWPVVTSCFDSTSSPGQPVCTDGAFIPCYAAVDPNSLTGPSGIASQRWLSGTQQLTYIISFENITTATAPAQQVVVTQPLSADLNLSSVSLLGITIPNGTSGANIEVPAPAGAFNPAAGVNEFTTTADLRPTQSMLVTVDAKLNTNTKTITWTLGSIDPATGLPPLNPLVGFLPPGVGGNVAFTVKPVQGLATGVQISDQAAVVFNANAPLSTPSWLNTIDNTPPVSHISALPETSSCPNFRVGWSGSDVGSGLQGFTVYASDNGGPFAPWLSNTNSVAATYTGSVGHTYSFCLVGGICG